MNDEITESVYFQKGYDQGFSEAQERLALEFNRALIIKEDLAFEKGYKAVIKKTKSQYKKVYNQIYDPNNRKSES